MKKKGDNNTSWKFDKFHSPVKELPKTFARVIVTKLRCEDRIPSVILSVCLL